MTVVALPAQSEIQRCDRQVWQEVQSEKISRHKIRKEPAHERKRHRRLVVKDQCRKDDDDQPQIRLMAQCAGVKSFFISLHSFLFICVSPLCKLASDFRPLVHVSHKKKSPKAIRLLNFFRVGLFFQIVSRGRGARTPIYGFGDRCSTIELFPYVLFFFPVPSNRYYNITTCHQCQQLF